MYINRARQLFTLNRYTEAVREAEKVLSHDPAHAEALGLIVNAYAFGDKPYEAERFGKTALAQQPNDAYILFGLGAANLRQGYGDTAESYFRTALRLENGEAATYANLAAALLLQKKHRQAEAAINKALELNPNSGAAHNLKSRILQRSDPQQAGESLRLAFKLSPDGAGNHEIAGRTAFARKDYEQAAFHFQQSLRQNPSVLDMRENFLRSLAYSHPTYGKFARYYPYAVGNPWQQMLVPTLLVLLTLSCAAIFGKAVTLVFALPFILWGLLFWIGIPLAKHRLFRQHFNREDYFLANPHFALQCLLQLSLLALPIGILTAVTEIKVLSGSAVLTAAMYLLYLRDLQNEVGEIHREYPWLTALFWLFIAALVPLMLWVGKEDVLTTGMS